MKEKKPAVGWLGRRILDSRGQTTTEYLLLISVVVIGVVASAYTFAPSIQLGTNELGFDVARIIRDHGQKGKNGQAGFGLAPTMAAESGHDPLSTGAAATMPGDYSTAADAVGDGAFDF